jgi:hypothetical protein
MEGGAGCTITVAVTTSEEATHLGAEVGQQILHGQVAGGQRGLAHNVDCAACGKQRYAEA